MNILKKLSPFIVIILISIPSVLPFLSSGFFPIHDNTQVARVYEMSKSLSDGMIPARVVEDLGYGYGYPIFNFYAPLSYYVGGFLDLTIFDSLQATKLMIVIGIFLSGVSMFLFSKNILGSVPGIVSATFYVYASYHAVNIYVRGAVGELWAYGLIPFVFWGLYRLSKEKNLKWIFITGISFGLVVLSHNLTALMSIPFVLFYVFFLTYLAKRNLRREVLSKAIIGLLFGVILSAFYWLPAITEINFTNVYSQIEGGSDFRKNFVCLNQLWYSPWGFGGSVQGCLDGMSLSPGKINLLVVPFSLFFLLVLALRKKIEVDDKEKIKHIAFAAISFLISLFLILDYSKVIWESISPLEFIQYPWRFLLMVSFFSSFIAGGVILLIEKVFLTNKNIKTIYLSSLVILLGVLVYTNLKLFVPQTYLNRSSDSYTNEKELKWTVSKISDEYLPTGFDKPTNENDVSSSEIKILSGDMEIVGSEKKVQEWKLDIRSFGESRVLIPLFYYPSWQADLEGKKLDLIKDPKGMSLVLPSGEYKITIKFKDTSSQKLGNLISLAGLTLLFVGIIKNRVFYGKKS